jgi:hypothetical protein
LEKEIMDLGDWRRFGMWNYEVVAGGVDSEVGGNGVGGVQILI